MELSELNTFIPRKATISSTFLIRKRFKGTVKENEKGDRLKTENLRR